MNSSSSVDQDEMHARDAFEEERKILLFGVTERLTSVVQQMTQANSNLKGLDESTCQLEKVAELWKAAYRQQSNDPSPAKASPPSSRSLLQDAA